MRPCGTGNVIQHNAGGSCALSPVGNDGEPDPLRAARVRTIRIMSCARVQPRGQCHAQQLAPAVSAAASFLSAAVAAIPAAPVPFCGGVIVGQPVIRGCRPAASA